MSRRRTTGLVVGALLLAACSTANNGRLENPHAIADESLAGNTVTVTGAVTEVLAGGAFLLDSSDFSVSDADETLILAAGKTPVQQGGFARVRGTIGTLSREKLDDQLINGYGEDVLSKHEGEVIVRAERVTPVANPGPAADVLERALDDPATEVRETLTFSARVRAVLGPQVFWIAGRGENGVAVITKLRRDISRGDVVAMTGTVRRYDPAQLRGAGFTLRSDVADEVRKRVDTGVVFVAEQITLVNTG